MKGRQSFDFFNPSSLYQLQFYMHREKTTLCCHERSPLCPLSLCCPFLTQMTWNWVRWTNATPMTRHIQGVQPNWTDLSDWGCGVRQPAHVLPLLWWLGYRGKQRGRHRPKEKVNTSLESRQILWRKQASLGRVMDVENGNEWEHAYRVCMCALTLWVNPKKKKKRRKKLGPDCTPSII